MTTLRPLSPTSSILEVGGTWAPVFATRDAYGYMSSAVTPTVVLTAPDGGTTAPVPTVLSIYGDWYVPVTLAAAGRYIAAVSTPEDSLVFAAYVDMPTTAAGMPTPADASVYLGTNAGTWTMAEITDAFNAERAAQRSKCGERAVYPDDLRQALLRRVQANLARRRLPLGAPTGDADAASFVPGRDPEVRRLEGPYRRTVMG